MGEYKPKNDYEKYSGVKPTSRVMELELIAFHKITGEEVMETLEMIDPKLRDEYDKLAYGDDDDE